MKQQYKKELLELASAIANPKDMDAFLSTVLTPSEYEDIALRLQILKLLQEGYTQRDVAEKLKTSIAKVTRGSKELQNRKNGFKKIVDTYLAL